MPHAKLIALRMLPKHQSGGLRSYDSPLTLACAVDAHDPTRDGDGDHPIKVVVYRQTPSLGEASLVSGATFAQNHVPAWDSVAILSCRR